MRHNLSQAEQLSLLNTFRYASCPKASESALKQLLEGHEGFLVSLTRVYSERYREDMRSSILERLVEALPSYDPERSAFSTWSHTVMRRARLGAYSGLASVVSIPKGRYWNNYLTILDVDLADACDDNPNSYELSQEDFQRWHTPNLQETYTDMKAQRVDLRFALDNLSKREAFVIREHYLEGRTIISLAPELELSQAGTNGVKIRALAKLRKHLKHRAWEDEDALDSLENMVAGCGAREEIKKEILRLSSIVRRQRESTHKLVQDIEEWKIIDMEENRKRLRKALDKLSREEYGLVSGRYLQGKPLKELARELNISYQLVQQRLAKALHKTRTHMEAK